jgi:glycosyltransferase involved in cell wall biosynthesis
MPELDRFPRLQRGRKHPTFREIKAAVEGKWTYEIVAVDDGSRIAACRAARGARGISDARPRPRKNSGQTAALDAAWHAARGKYVVSLDADLQNDPADIPAMMQRLRTRIPTWSSACA